MAIISVLVLLGASALASARDSFVVDGITEEVISTIRDAQNRSISISEGQAAWGMSNAIESLTGTHYIILVKMGSDLTTSQHGAAFRLINGATITPVNPPARSIFFMAPFGTPHITQSRTVCSGSASWVLSEKPSQELEPTATCSSTNELAFKIEYKGITKIVKVNKIGDTTVE